MPSSASSVTTAFAARRRALARHVQSPTRVGQIVLGVFWFVDGLLKLQPYFAHHFVSGVIDPNAIGQPAPVADVITWVAGVIAPHQELFALLAAASECAIGVALLVRRTVTPALVVSFAWAVNIWLTGEGFGGLFTGTAPTPLTGVIGTAPLYIIAGLLVWPRAARAGNTEPGPGLLGAVGARVVWAALWLGAATLWLLPANAGGDALRSAFDSAPSGAGWLTSLHSAVAGAVGGSGTTITVVLAVVSAEIGLCVLWARGARIALLCSIPISLAFWLLAEGFGGLLTGQATDVGTAPLMILIAALLLPVAQRSAPAAARAQMASAHAADQTVSRA